MIEGKPTAYLDTCVLIDMVDGKHGTLRQLITSDQVRAVYSDATLSDLSGNDTMAKIDLLDQLVAWHVFESTDADFTVCATNKPASSRLQELQLDGIPELETFETALHQLMSDLGRKKSGRTLGESVVRLMGATLPIVRRADDWRASDRAENSLSSQLEGYIETASGVGGQSVDDYRAEMDAKTGGAGRNGGLRPPRIIEQIINNTDEAERPGLRGVLAMQVITFGALIERALMLADLGFARERSIYGTDEIKSLGGSRSESFDVQHIALALCCGLFVTSDRRSAKKFYALSEYYGIGAAVIHFAPDGEAILIGEHHWPF
jgi:hypothetical protein